MDDLSARLAEILNDPDSMKKVQQMAENLLGDGGGEEPPESPSESVFPQIDPQMMTKMMGIMSRLKNTGTDRRTELLLALRPHLGERRQEKLDTAVKLLRLIDVLPALKSSGLLDF